MTKFSERKIDNLLKIIRSKLLEYQKSESYDFREFIDEKSWRIRKGVLNFPGAYVVFEENEPIYVGSAGKGKHLLKYRIQDLFHDYRAKNEERKYYHTLTSKLLKYRFNSLNEIRNFYIKKCRIKIVETETVTQARIIETILIELLKPRFNS
ncbi:MAG: hypothetical protein QXV52_05995 [Nitrososphaeria archaeon]